MSVSASITVFGLQLNQFTVTCIRNVALTKNLTSRRFTDLPFVSTRLNFIDRLKSRLRNPVYHVKTQPFSELQFASKVTQPEV